MSGVRICASYTVELPFGKSELIYVGHLFRIVRNSNSVFGWVLYRWIIKKKRWLEIQPNLQLAVFVTGFWILVYFVLLS